MCIAEDHVFFSSEKFNSTRILKQSQYTTHDPIRINGNEGFLAQGYPGTGTENDPYIIANFEIEVEYDDPAIEIRETDVYFVIKNCRVSMEFGIAIIFLNVLNGCVESCEITGGNIEFDHSNNCEIVDCVLQQFEWETIAIYFSKGCTLSGNYIHHCQTGIFLLGSNDSLIYDNYLIENYIGIDLYLCINISLIENILKKNGMRLSLWGAGFDGYTLLGSNFANISHYFVDNLVNGKPLGFFFNKQSIVIDGNQYGQVILLNCRDARVKNGEFSNATNGIQVLHSQNCVISNATIDKHSMWGVDILYSNETIITGCKIQENEETGIFTERSNNTIISYNQISGNIEGVNLHSSSHCIIENNCIENNGIGLDFYNSRNCTIIDNIIHYNSRYGVYFSGSSIYNRFYRNSFGWNTISHIGRDWPSDSYYNYWDDGISQGNAWSDYSGFGIYQENSYDIDHYPTCIGICPLFIIVLVISVISATAIILVITYRRRHSSL